MRKTMAFRTILAPIFFLLLPGALAAVDNNFSMYPSDAESCLYSAASGSGCDGNTVPENNDCLCGNKKGGWVALVADCLGSTGVASSTIADTYSQMQTNCGDSGTPLGLTREEFFNHVDDASSSTTATTKKDDPTTATDDSKHTTQTATSEKTTVVVTVSGEPSTMTTVVANTDADYTGTDSTSSPTSTGGAGGEEVNDNGGGGGGGLSNTAKIGIIASCVGVAVIGIIAAVYIIMRRRVQAAKKAQAESHPMLPGQQQPTAFPPTDPTLPSQSVSPNPSAMYGGSPAPQGVGAAAAVAAGMYKDDDKWRPQSAAWTPQSQQTTAYSPQVQWSQQQQQMHPGPYGAPPPHPPPPPQQQQQQQFVAAELPDNQDHQLYELGDSMPRGPMPGRR